MGWGIVTAQDTVARIIPNNTQCFLFYAASVFFIYFPFLSSSIRDLLTVTVTVTVTVTSTLFPFQ